MKRSGFISPQVQSDLASSASRPCRVPIAIFPGHVDSLAWTVIKIVMGVRGTVSLSLSSNAPSITDRSARLRPDNAAETGCRTATSIAIYEMVRVRSRDKSRLRKIRRMRATCAGFVSFSFSSSLDYIMSIKSPISHGIGI